MIKKSAKVKRHATSQSAMYHSHRPYSSHGLAGPALIPSVLPILVALVVGGIGIALSRSSSAAVANSQTTVTAEAESGAVRAPAQVVSTSKSTISGDGVVYFGNSTSAGADGGIDEGEEEEIAETVDSATSAAADEFYEKFCTGNTAGEKVGTVSSTKLSKISGIAASRKKAGYAWVHNDAGGTAAIYAVNSAGKLISTQTVSGASNVDWEDIDVAAGKVYVADTGTNKAARSTVYIYRFAEPDPSKSSTVKATRITVKFADGKSHNTEAMFVDPKGVIYLIDKSDKAATSLWKASGTGTSLTMQKVSTLGYKSTGKAYEEITAADMSIDGKYIAIQTYKNIYMYKVGGSSKACKMQNPGGSKVEAIAFNTFGTGLVSISEGRKQGVFAIRAVDKQATAEEEAATESEDTESEDTTEDEETATKTKKKPATSSKSATGCKIDKSAKLKDQDNEDTQHPWKVKTKGEKVVINFITKGITGKHLDYMKAGQTAWNKSDCIDVQLVNSCPSGGNCVNVKFNDGGGADGNYSEKVSGGFQKSTGDMEMDKSLSANELKNVTIHEMGHAIGLKHVKTKHVMMNTETYDDVFEPNANDWHNLKVLYANQK